jgi:dihydrofolate reductase
MTRIGLVWAEAEGHVIGRDGVMPWHIPEDLAHFKAITLGSAVLMGRKTWDSLPERFRPLDGRRNIVITRQSDWAAEGVEVAHSLENALTLAGSESSSDDESWMWVIGGAEIYAAVIDRADRLEVTEIRASIAGDAFAPAIPGNWRVVDRDPDEGWRTSRTGTAYRFVRYERTP